MQFPSVLLSNQIGNNFVYLHGLHYPILFVYLSADTIVKFLKGTHASIVMELGYNYQYLYDLRNIAAAVGWVKMLRMRATLSGAVPLGF